MPLAVAKNTGNLSAIPIGDSVPATSIHASGGSDRWFPASADGFCREAAGERPAMADMLARF
ncbi:hypothetical protein AVM02_02405 [Brucella anthropi]